MTQKILYQLSSQFDIHLNTVQQLRNGHNLMFIAYKVLYQQQNAFLSNKLTNYHDSLSKSQLNQSTISNQSNTNKVGTNVILINTLLKHIKNDKTKNIPNNIKQLTFFNLLEDDQLLSQFIQWMIQSNQTTKKYNQNQRKQTQIQSNPYQEQENFSSVESNRFRNINIQSTQIKQNQRFKTQSKQTITKTQQKQQNQLENLYFASNLKQKLTESPPNPQSQNTDRIVRKGSFKLLKPKVMFTQQNNPDRQPKELTEHNKIPKKNNQIYQPDELKQISMIQSHQNNLPSTINNIQPNFYQQMSHFNDSIDQIVDKKINATLSMTQQQQNHRKTVPKNLSKPPLYRSSIKNKQNLTTESKTIEQKLKKKNFFNFQTQEQDLVSNFNYETVKSNQKSQDKKLSLKKVKMNEEKMREFYSGNSSQNLLKKQQKNFYNLQNNNIIEEDDYFNVQQSIEAQERKQSSNRKQSNFTNSSSLLKLKNHFLQKQLYSLDQQIQSQQNQLKSQIQKHQEIKQNKTFSIQKSAQTLKNSRSKNESFSSSKKSNRKVSKVQINMVQDKVKQDIIDWLDSIHIIDGSQINLNELTEIFRNGVKFVQLCNHYIGRGRAIPYFNNPRKNAEIHSNFSKVFEHLKSFSPFTRKQLLFAYQLFVPFPQQGSIWTLLEAIYKLFNKKGAKTNKSKNKDLSLHIQQSNESSEIRNLNQKFVKLNHSIQITSTKQTQQINHFDGSVLKKQKSSSSFKSHNATSSRKQSTFSKPIEFIPMIPDLPQHNDLVQQCQEPEDNEGRNVLNINQDNLNGTVLAEGYKQKYLRRAIDKSTSKDHNKSAKNFFSLQTPKKHSVSNLQQSFIGQNRSKILSNTIIGRSSSKKALESQIKKLQNSSHKINSVRKNSNKKTISKLPKVTLNMQIKVDKIINQFNLGSCMNQTNQSSQFKKPQLFQDPIRNGTLINILFAKLILKQVKYFKSPQSIDHCRLNYSNIFGLLKNKYGHQMFESIQVFMEMVEQILKGQKNMFYAVAYQMIQTIGPQRKQNFNSTNLLENDLKNSCNQFYSKKVDTNLMNKSEMIRLYCVNLIQWIRLIQLTNPLISTLKIRSSEDLYDHISSGAFLYLLLQNPSVNMVYLNSQRVSEKEANLKKVMVYMIQMKIFKREEFTNIHQIAQKNTVVIDNLLLKLVEYTVSKEWSYIEKNMSNLKKHLIKDVLLINNQTDIFNNSSAYESSRNETNQTTFQKMIMKNQNLQSLERNKFQQTLKKREKAQTKRQKEQFEVEIPWMRKLGFSECSLNLNNGILLCRLISKLTRTNIKYNENISHDANIPKPQALANIRKALKLIPGSRVDQIDVYNADERKTLQIYNLIKDKFRNNYEMGKVISVR